MVALNRNWRPLPAASHALPPGGRLAGRVRRYFARHPDVSPQEFLWDAVIRELRRREGPGEGPRPAGRPPLTEEDVRFHVWLNQRLEALDYEWHGLWPRFRRLLFSSRLMRRLVSGNSVV